MVSRLNNKLKRRKVKLKRTTIYSGKDRMNLTDEMDLCDDGNILSNKDKLLKICKLLGGLILTLQWDNL